MSVRVPLVLLVIAALLLGYILIFERGHPGQRELASRSGFLLESFVRDRVTGIRIAAGDNRVALRRRGEGFDETWTVEEPEKLPADPEPIEDYVRSWEFAVPVRKLQNPSEADVERFGLRSPKAEVTFEMGRSTVRATLGSGSPVDGGGYVRIDDDKAVVVVGKDVVELFEQNAETFAMKDDGGAPFLEDLETGSQADEAP